MAYVDKGNIIFVSIFNIILFSFEFYEENGKRINLYDWYIQFLDRSQKRKESDDITQ